MRHINWQTEKYLFFIMEVHAANRKSKIKMQKYISKCKNRQNLADNLFILHFYLSF